MVTTFINRAAAIAVVPMAFALVASANQSRPGPAGSYEDLVGLFNEFLTFDPPKLLDGAPDYSAASISKRRIELTRFQARLTAIDPRAWPSPAGRSRAVKAK